MAMKGQIQIVGLMLAVLGILAVIVMIEPLKEGIDIARDASHLNCAGAGLTVATQLTCIVVDWQLLAFVGTGLAVAISFIGLRSLRQGVAGD